MCRPRSERWSPSLSFQRWQQKPFRHSWVPRSPIGSGEPLAKTSRDSTAKGSASTAVIVGPRLQIYTELVLIPTALIQKLSAWSARTRAVRSAVDVIWTSMTAPSVDKPISRTASWKWHVISARNIVPPRCLLQKSRELPPKVNLLAHFPHLQAFQEVGFGYALEVQSIDGSVRNN